MITHIANVCIFVSDQDRAKKFYTEVLGFELKGDQPVAPDSSNRWLTVTPQGAATDVILYLVDEHWEQYRSVVGQPQAVGFHVSDMDALYADLKAKGVEFPQEPVAAPWGTFATFKDSEGNTIMLVQPPQ